MPSFPPPHLFVANVLLLPSKSDELQHKSRIWPQIYTISKYYNVYISVKVKCNGANVTEIRRYFEKSISSSQRLTVHEGRVPVTDLYCIGSAQLIRYLGELCN